MFRQKEHWGPSLWKFIHTICVIDFEDNVPHVEHVISILQSILKVIPCHMCRSLYEEHLQKLNSFDKTQSMVLFKWSWELHNAVNKKRNQPEISYEDALQKYTNKI